MKVKIIFPEIHTFNDLFGMLNSQLGSNKAYRTVLLVNNLLIYIYKKETKWENTKGLVVRFLSSLSWFRDIQ